MPLLESPTLTSYWNLENMIVMIEIEFYQAFLLVVGCGAQHRLYIGYIVRQ